MAGKNQVTLTFAGDNDQLKKVFGEVGDAADKAATEVGQASDKMASELGGATKRMSDDVRKSAESFDRAAEATDTLDTRAMGFRDTVTGVQDSVVGLSRILKGDLSADALFVAGAGVGDLASGFTNLLIPGIKSTVGWLGRAKDATLAFVTTARGATLALGAVGVAIGAVVLAYQAFQRSSQEVEVSTDKLVVDLERLARTGRATGEIVKLFGDDASELRGHLESLDPSLRESTSAWESFLDAVRVERAESDELRDYLSELDSGLAQIVESGGDGTAALQAWAEWLGLSEEELQHVIDALPQYRQELERAEERQRDQERAILDTIDTLEEYADTLRAQTDPLFGFINAQEGVTEAQQNVNQALEEFGADSPQYRQALIDLANAELDLHYSAIDAGQAMDQNLIPALQQLVDDGVLSADAFEVLTQEIQSAEQAAHEADGTRFRLYQELVTRYTVIGQPPMLNSGGQMQFHHQGGHAVPGYTWVGERGPELMKMDQTTEILNNSTSRRLASQSGSMSDQQSVVISVERGGGSSTEQQVSSMVLHLLRTGALRLNVQNNKVVAGVS